MKPYKARGIVLHTVKYGDSSMVVYMLTDTMGRQNYMVQGVRSRRGHGNKAALFQPMFIVELEGMELANAQMHRIREVRNLMPLSSVPFDVRKSTIALFMAEVVYKLVREAEVNSPLFEFLLGTVAALDALDEGVANVHLWFLVRLSCFLGFYPGNEYTPGAWFDIREGVFTPAMPPHRLALSQDNARILSLMMDTGLDALSAVGLSRSQRSEFLAAVLNYFGYHLDMIHSVRSIDILREVF